MQKCGRCKVDKPLEDFCPSYRGRPGTRCRKCDALYKRTPEILAAPHDPLQCSNCEQQFIPKALNKQAAAVRYCSQKCKELHRKVRRVSRKAASLRRHCVHCGIELPPTMRSDAKFCSEQCNSAAHAITRKMAKRASRARTPGDPLVERNAIAKRDGYRCGICAEHVDMQRRYPDPLAPSIDHVVPLARGGSNELDNLQLSHLACNVRKRDALVERAA